MVIKNDFDAKIKMMEPQPLKFGMDRILSEETSSGNSKSEGNTIVVKKKVFFINLVTISGATASRETRY